MDHLVDAIRQECRDHDTCLPVLHIGPKLIPGMPADVANLPETFKPQELLDAVYALVG